MAGSGLFRELRRRHVWRVAIAYAVVSWLLLQLAAILFPAFGAPHWAIRLLFAFLVIGLPVAILLAWAFEVTPEGVRRTEPEESETARPAGHRRQVGRVLNVGIIVVLAAAVGILLWRQFGTSPKRQTPPVAVAATAGVGAPAAGTAIPAKSIAVLPFENLNVDQKDAYFVAGMQDLILTKLADIGGLKVISRTSTMRYKSHPEDLKSIGRQLGVATLLEGSVQKSGDQVLINVQLINARTDSHIWAKSYTRTLKNVFGVEGEVAEQIAKALKARLSPAETQRLATALSTDPAANDLYLRAEYFTHQADLNFTMTSFKQAISLYKQAIAKVPDFALARARLSYVESILAEIGGGGEDVKHLRAEARSQAERALALAPDLTAAHLAIGYSDYWGRGDYAAARRAFAAALKLSPNDAHALAARGIVLIHQGRFEAAIAAFQQALAHDPRNSARADDLGQTYMTVSRYAEAETAFQHALALNPDNVSAKYGYSRVRLLATGNIPRALAAAQGSAPLLRGLRVDLLTYQRKYKAALALLADIPDTPDNFPPIIGSKSLQQADLYRLAGDGARARALYMKALPLARAQLKAQAGSAIAESIVWESVADAELGLGHTAAGLAAIAKSQALIVRAHDHANGPGVMEYSAELYAEARRPDLAVPLLAKALATSGIGASYSPVMLWLDPAWNPIRHDPRFQALLKKYAKYQPATATTVAPPASTGLKPATS